METIYCDDVRVEVGNKLSYIGVYGSNLLFNELPAVLPKLCVVMSLYLPEDTKAKSVTFSLFNNEQTVGRSTVSIDAVRNASMPPRELGTTRYLSIRFIAQIAPLQVDAACRLKARADVDGQAVQGGTLVVEKAGQSEAA
jgi:hypothetical protein